MATETLRPNAAGDETSINYQNGAGSHWDKVDEAVADDWTTWIANDDSSTYQRDLYNLPASSGSGTINKITVYARLAFDSARTGKISIKAGSTVADGAEKSTGDTDWNNYSEEWALNPDDSKAWEWADIDALQIGVSLNGDSDDYSQCTQVYVEVDYTESTTSIKTVMGVPIADIKTVNGVAIADVKSFIGVST